MEVGWPVDLTWYKLLVDQGSFIGGAFALIAGVVAYRGALKAARLQVEAMRQQMAAAQQSANEQIAVAERQISEMRTQGHQVERAYISGGGYRSKEVVGMSAQSTPIMRDTDTFEFHVNNYGKTPGTVFKLGYGFCDETNVPPIPTYAMQYLQSPIDPGRGGLPVAWQPIPPEHAARPIAYGRFYYRTIFGTCHSSGFFYRILRNVNPEPIRPPTPDYVTDRDEPAE